MVFGRLLSLILLTLWSSLSHAQPTRPMSFSVFWPCAGNASFCAPRILADGAIERDSSRKFVAFLNNARRSGDNLPPKPAVCFNSPGGDLHGGMELGRVIRGLGFYTCLAPSYSRVIPGTGGEDQIFIQNVVCASACAFALVGGVNRLIESGSRYGVHQFYGARGDIGDSPTQVTVVVLATYLEQMGISRSLLDLASLVGPQDIRWLTQEQLQKLRVDNMATVSSQWKLDALKDGTVVATVAQVKPGAQSRVTLSVLKNQGQAVLLIAFTPGQQGQDVLQEALNAVSQEPLAVRIDGQQIAAFKFVQWRIIRESIVVGVPLSARAAERLRLGNVLGVAVSLARAYDQYDPSIEVSLERAESILAAALK